MYDIVSVGEILIDFTPLPDAAGRNPVYEQNPGGAPANVAVSAARMGARTAFIGKVGKDQFGRFLLGALKENGVSGKGLCLSDKHSTSLAFVTLGENGEREFYFCRDADMALEPGDVAWELFDNARLVHVSSLAFSGKETASTAREIIARAKSRGAAVSYDANWRPALWADEDAGKESLREGIAYADIVKASEEELVLLTGEADEEKAAEKLLRAGPSVLAVTRGAEGSTVYTADLRISCPAVKGIRPVDTTGAGDAFFGAFLREMLSGGRAELTAQQLYTYQSLANAAAGLSTTKPGGISSLPTREEVLQLLGKR